MTPRAGEFELIAALFAPLAKTAPGALGLTDDAALMTPAAGHDLVVTVDTVVGGVHFRADDPPGLVGQKALRVNLSDLAAKGARALGFLQALSLNDSITDDYLRAYADGLKHDVELFGVPLLGGDTTSGPGPLSISITALGEVPAGEMLLRSGARAGDALCVTGTIGDGALGLMCLSGSLRLDRPLADFLIDRYRIPQPRLRAGAMLRGRATACLDVSDGLVADVAHICTASNVAAIIERDAVPLSPAGRAAVENDPGLWAQILGGGDDYELAFTVPHEACAALAGASEAAGIPLTVIGRIVSGDSANVGGVTVVDRAGRPVDVPRAGYRHR